MNHSRLLALFRLSKREYFADFFITPPLTIALAILSLVKGAGWPWALWFVVGVFAWTFYEYATHRWISHKLWLFREAHYLHHFRPRDYIAVHPAATLIFYVTFWLTFGFSASAVMVGFSTGYIAYSIAHTLFHYGDIRPGALLSRAKQRHTSHHRYASVNFGVTTAFWDRVFGTYLESIA